MKLIMDKPEILKDSINVIGSIFDEVVMKFKDDGLAFNCAEKGSNMLVQWKLLKSNFTTYEITQDKLSFKVKDLKQVLDRVKADDKFILELKDNSWLQATVRGNTISKYKILLMDTESKDHKPPKIEWKARVSLPTSTFKEMIETARYKTSAKEPGNVLFKVNKDKAFIVEGYDDQGVNASSKLIMNSKDCNIANDTDKDVVTRAQMCYIDQAIKAGTISSITHLRFSSDFPLRLDFKVPDKVSFIFIIAPLVPNEDERDVRE